MHFFHKTCAQFQILAPVI